MIAYYIDQNAEIIEVEITDAQFDTDGLQLPGRFILCWEFFSEYELAENQRRRMFIEGEIF